MKPAPCSTNELATSKKREGGNNQKLMLFRRGNAISGAPIIRGTNMFNLFLRLRENCTLF